MRNRAPFIALAFVLLSGPACGKESTKTNRPENVEIFSSIGDTMVRVELRESLPNAFGVSDVFGRKRARGVVLLSYNGLRDNKAVIRRRTVDIISNETTMSRSGMSSYSGTATTQGSATAVGPFASYGATTNYSGIVTRAPEATVTALPPDTIETLVDPVGGYITVEDRVVRLQGADANVVRFKILSNPRTK